MPIILTERKQPDTRPVSPQEMTDMAAAADELFLWLRTITAAELEFWARDERRSERLRVIHALQGVKQAMRS